VSETHSSSSVGTSTKAAAADEEVAAHPPVAMTKSEEAVQPMKVAETLSQEDIVSQQKDLFRAVMQQDIVKIQALLDGGVDIHAQNKAEETPLEMAISRGKQRAADFLTEYIESKPPTRLESAALESAGATGIGLEKVWTGAVEDVPPSEQEIYSEAFTSEHSPNKLVESSLISEVHTEDGETFEIEQLSGEEFELEPDNGMQSDPGTAHQYASSETAAEQKVPQGAQSTSPQEISAASEIESELSFGAGQSSADDDFDFDIQRADSPQILDKQQLESDRLADEQDYEGSASFASYSATEPSTSVASPKASKDAVMPSPTSQPGVGSAPSAHAELDHSTSVVSDMAEVASEDSFAAETSGAGDTMYELPKSDRTVTGGERAQADSAVVDGADANTADGGTVIAGANAEQGEDEQQSYDCESFGSYSGTDHDASVSTSALQQAGGNDSSTGGPPPQAAASELSEPSVVTETDHAEADSKVAVLDSASVGADETVIPQPDAGSAPSAHAELDHSTSVVSDVAEVASEGSFAAGNDDAQADSPIPSDAPAPEAESGTDVEIDLMDQSGIMPADASVLLDGELNPSNFDDNGDGADDDMSESLDVEAWDQSGGLSEVDGSIAEASLASPTHLTPREHDSLPTKQPASVAPELVAETISAEADSDTDVELEAWDESGTIPADSSLAEVSVESVRARTADDGSQNRHANRTEVESATTISAKQQESRHEESEEALSTKRVENVEAATGTAVATTATTDAGPATDSSVSEASFSRREASLDAGELSGSLGVEEWDESGDLPLDASVAESSLEAVLTQPRGTGSPNAAASRAAAAADDGGDLSISSSVREGRLAGVAVDEAETVEAAAGPATDSSVSEASFSRREASLDAGELSGSLGVEEWDESGDLPLDASVAESSWKVVSAEAPESKPDGVVNEQLVDMVTSSILEQLIVEEALALRTPHDSETSQGDVQEQRQHHQHQHEHPEEPGLSSAHQDEIVDQITSSILNQLVLQEVVAAMAGINE
jgi:hypothetical protein